MGRKSLNTPRSRIVNGIRLVWMRSRERIAALKKTSYCCTDCGIKQSAAKGREVKLQVHHEPPIDKAWKEIVDMIAERILQSEQVPLCKPCHKARHDTIKLKKEMQTQRMLDFRNEDKHDAEMEALHNDTEAACGDLYESL